MPYNGMTPKQKRVVASDVESLFSPKAFITKPTLEDIKRLDFFHPTVKYKRATRANFILPSYLGQRRRFRVKSSGSRSSRRASWPSRAGTGSAL